MINHIRRFLLIVTAQVTIVFSMQVFAVSTDVLDLNEVSSADSDTLLADTRMFNTIGMGIALSIAQCDGREICDLTVDEGEIEQLIDALDQRIESIVSRQQNNEEELSNIVTAYVDTKEKYIDYMDRLSKIGKSVEPELTQEEFAEEDIFADEDALTEDEFSAFDDFDESLEDDEDIEGFTDENVPEDN
jgi:hypothetical protein